jgi:hypothetical protein
MKSPLAMCMILSAPLLLTGCSRGIEKQQYLLRVISGAEPEEVFLAAQVILRREFGPLKSEQESRRLTSRPVEFRTSSDSGTARDLYGGRSTMRRTAHFVASSRGEEAVARLRIEIEREDTARQAVFQPDRDRRLSDSPSQTAIERDAATSTRQNSVWTYVKRDRRLERALLAELQEKLAPPPSDAPQSDAAGTP